ncbi:MAG: hypothetical protein HXY25_12265 [Alphaproteobacteria bacterium]|nr:hypothetical protein [Alphaproteobacteria bacterium]
MNHHHRKILHALFAHPISANIAMKDVESVLRELGAELDHAHSGRLHARLKGHSASFAHGHHSLPKEEVIQFRKFLEGCGIDPARDYPL